MNTNEMQSGKEYTSKEGVGKGVWLFAIAHMLCCGVPLLILSGVSIFTLLKTHVIISISLALLGIIGFIWYLKRGCATCSRNEGRCTDGICKTKIKS